MPKLPRPNLEQGDGWDAAIAALADGNARIRFPDHITKRAAERIRRHKAVLEWKAPTNRDIVIAFPADLHVGASYCDYEALIADLELIRHTDRVFAVLGGDGIDNHIKHLGAIIAAGMTPTDQWDWYARMIGYMAPKLIAVVGGNHEAWTMTLSGYDPLKTITTLAKLPYHPHQICIDVQAGATKYRLRLRHKFRFNSSLNPAHSVKRMYDEFGHYDIGVVCDKHELAVDSFMRDGLERIAIRPGSYQITGDFAQSLGFRDARPQTPAVLLRAGTRDLHGFTSVQWAIRALNGPKR